MNSVEETSAPTTVVGSQSPSGLGSSGSATNLRVRRLNNLDELAPLADDWNRLAQDVPFRRFDWLTTWWRHYGGANGELFVLAVEDEGGRLAGLAPWYIESTFLRGRVVQFLGGGEVCSEYVTILSSPGRERSVAGALAQWLSRERSWELLELIGTEPSDRVVSALKDQLSAAGFAADERSGFNCWRIALPPSWDEFVAKLNSDRRGKVRQATRKHINSGQAAAYLLSEPAEFDRRFDMFIDLHQRRHQDLGHPGCFASPRFTAFHREIGRRFCELGKLRLVWTEFAGRPVAADYSFLGGETIYCYQMGMQPHISGVSPGWLNMIASLKWAIEAGFRNFDYLRGDEPYKLSWGAQTRPTVETRIAGKTGAARLRYAIWLGNQRLRRWAKQRLLRRLLKTSD